MVFQHAAFAQGRPKGPRDGSAHPVRDSDNMYYHTVTAASSTRSPMTKVMDIFRNRSHGTATPDERRKVSIWYWSESMFYGECSDWLGSFLWKMDKAVNYERFARFASFLISTFCKQTFVGKYVGMMVICNFSLPPRNFPKLRPASVANGCPLPLHLTSQLFGCDVRKQDGSKNISVCNKFESIYQVGRARFADNALKFGFTIFPKFLFFFSKTCGLHSGPVRNGKVCELTSKLV